MYDKEHGHINKPDSEPGCVLAILLIIVAAIATWALKH